MNYAVQQQQPPTAPVCQTCRNGYLVKRSVPRMSGPAVAIGYILLIPSVLGIITSIGFWMLTTFAAAGSTAATSPGADPEAAAAGAGCCLLLGSGGTLCSVVTFFVSGLVGWLLIMKKDVLQCESCSATIAAS